jgi:UDP-glucuronate 4-epimerase
MSSTILVTGAAGFIGCHLSEALLKQGYTVVGIDNMNDYYDVRLKEDRLGQLKMHPEFIFKKGDIADADLIDEIFFDFKPEIVVSLAAQAGVRYSIENPDAYMKSNVIGFYNILEACRHHPPRHLVYASSSSVYGANKKIPFAETDPTDRQVSLYGATKKANEALAYSYSSLYRIPATGLRFFTVYGPMGRPDMAYFLFAQKYFKREPILLFNNRDFERDLARDFTYIDDIVGGIGGILHQIPDAEVPHRIFNIGNNRPVKLMHFVSVLEKSLSRALGKTVEFEKIFEPVKAGDVPLTYACIDSISQCTGFKPKTTIEEGLQKFADWYVEYYHET